MPAQQVWQNLHNALERTASERDRYREALECILDLSPDDAHDIARNALNLSMEEMYNVTRKQVKRIPFGSLNKQPGSD